MSLLADISGLKGENLCSAMLSHLLLRTPDVRHCVMRLISDLAPERPVLVRNQFAVFCEEAAVAEDSVAAKRGRVDLVIETDDAVVGVENKFHAPFQEGQPAGYVDFLRQRSAALSKIRDRAFTHVLVVLAPERRRSEVEAKFVEQGLIDGAFLSWEVLLRSLGGLEVASPIDRFLIREFRDYAEAQIGSAGDFGRLLPHLHKSWTPRGTAVHRDFMNTFIWALLDEAVKTGNAYRCAAGKGYYGFYLRPATHQTEDTLWIGFCERSELPNRAALLVCAKTPLRLPAGPSQRAVTQNGWTNWGWTCTEIVFETSPDWKTLEPWVASLRPLNELIQRAADEAPSLDRASRQPPEPTRTADAENEPEARRRP